MHPILKKLSGGGRGSIGRSNEVVTEVLARPANFRHVFAGLTSDDAVVRMRAADAVEKSQPNALSFSNHTKENSSKSREAPINRKCAGMQL